MAVCFWPQRRRPRPEATALPSYQFPKPYCGISCVYACLRAAGKDIPFQALLRRKYIGCQLGSSIAELASAARDHGLFAEPVGRLTVENLRGASTNIILHTKYSPRAKQYDHFVLFVGMDGDKFRIFDPPEPIQTLNAIEVRRIWDGEGLLVSARPIDEAPFMISLV
jgi:ABC-type bacteriocin/lantibiotic exporter with double-glycine peptidase domain